MDERIRKAQAGDKKAMEDLITGNVGLIWSVVRRFHCRGVETEDLFQLAVIGLIKAIKRFDCSFQNQLSTYAVSMMIGEIKRFLRDDGMIKVSRSQKEICAKVCEMREYHLKQFGIDLSMEEIAKMLNLAKEDILMALEASSVVDSLDKPFDLEQGTESLSQKIPEKKDDYEKLINRMTIHTALEALSEKEKKVIIFRYYKNLTQAQIAVLIGTSQVQISRIEKKALQKMSAIAK